MGFKAGLVAGLEQGLKQGLKGLLLYVVGELLHLARLGNLGVEHAVQLCLTLAQVNAALRLALSRRHST